MIHFNSFGFTSSGSSSLTDEEIQSISTLMSWKSKFNTDAPDIVNIWDVDTNSRLISTNYTLESGTNSIKLGKDHKLSAGGSELTIQIGSEYYFALLQTIGQNNKVFFNKITEPEAVKTIQSGSDDIISDGTGTIYTTTDTEIITGINLIPAETGYLTYTIYDGDSNEGTVIYSKTQRVIDSDVGNEITLKDTFGLENNKTIYTEFSGIDLYGSTGDGAYTTINYYVSELIALPTEFTEPLVNNSGILGLLINSEFFSVNEDKELTLNYENIDATKLKNASSLISGTIQGTFDESTVITDFADAIQGNFWIYQSTNSSSLTLAGYTFNDGDVLWCYSDVTAILNDTLFPNYFSYVKDNTAIATDTVYGKTLLSTTVPSVATETGSAGTTNGTVANYDHSHPFTTQPAKFGGTGLTTIPKGSILYSENQDVLSPLTNITTANTVLVNNSGSLNWSNTPTVNSLLATSKIAVGTDAINTGYELYIDGNTYASGITSSLNGYKAARVSDEAIGLKFVNQNTGSLYSVISDNGNLTLASNDNIEFANFSVTNDKATTSSKIHINITDSDGYLTVDNSELNTDYNFYNSGTSYLNGAVSIQSTLYTKGTTTQGVTDNTTNTNRINNGRDWVKGGITIGSSDNSSYNFYNRGTSYFKDYAYLSGGVYFQKGDSVGINFGTGTDYTVSKIFDYSSGNLTLATDDVIEFSQIIDTSTGETDDTAMWMSVQDKTLVLNTTTYQSGYTFYNGGTSYQTGKATFAGAIVGTSTATISSYTTIGTSTAQTTYPLYVNGNAYISGYIDSGVKLKRSSDDGIGLQIFNTSGNVVSWITDDGAMKIASDDLIQFANFDNAASPTLNTPYTHLAMTSSASYLTVNKSSSQSTYPLYVGGNAYTSGNISANGGLKVPRTSDNGIGIQIVNPSNSSVYSWIFDDGNLTIATDDIVEFANFSAGTNPTVNTPHVYIKNTESNGYLSVNTSSVNSSYNFYNNGTTFLNGDTIIQSGSKTLARMTSSKGGYFYGYTGAITGSEIVGYSSKSSISVDPSTYSTGNTTIGSISVPAGTWIIYANFYFNVLASSGTLFSAKFNTDDDTQDSFYSTGFQNYINLQPMPLRVSGDNATTVNLTLYLSKTITSGTLKVTYMMVRIA